MDSANEASNSAGPSNAILYLIIGILISLGGQALGSYGLCLQAAALKEEKNKKEVEDLAIVSHATNTPRSSLKPNSNSNSHSHLHESPSQIYVQQPELVANSNISSRCSTPTGGFPSSMEAPLLVSDRKQFANSLEQPTMAPLTTSFKEYAKLVLSPKKTPTCLGENGKDMSQEFAATQDMINISWWSALKSRLYTLRWHIGLSLYILSQIFGSAVALAFLPTDLVAPLSNSSLFFNAVFSRIMLGILITGWDVTGTVLVIAGAVLISCFGSTSSNMELDLDRLKALYLRPVFLAYFITQVGLVICGFIFTKYLEYRLRSDKPFHYAQILASLRQQSLEETLSQIHVQVPHSEGSDDEGDSNTSNSSTKSLLPSKIGLLGKGSKQKKPVIDTAKAQAMIEDSPAFQIHSGKSLSQIRSDHKIMGMPYHLLPVVCACLYSGIGGVLASQSILMAKTVILLFSNLLSESLAYFVHVFFTNFLPPFLIVGTVMSLLTQLYSLNKCIALVPSLTMLTVPVFSTWYNSLSLVNGIVYWDDWGFWSAHLSRLLICIFGVLLNVAGVLFLSFNKAQKEQEEEKRTAARVSLLVNNGND